jgi:hypothetical protein
MPKNIAYSELRRIKDSLPDGSIHHIAKQLNLSVETIRNYFGGDNYTEGESCGVHIEPGPDGGFVALDDTSILDMALEILKENNIKYE